MTAAPEITVDTCAAARVAAALRLAPREIRKELLLVLRGAARLVATDARTLLRRGGADLPNRRTGRLARSIRSRKARGLAYLVSSEQPGGAPVGKFFETSLEKPRFTAAKRGRQPRGVLQQRPFLTRALDARRDETQAAIAAAIDKALRDSVAAAGR